MVGYAIGVLYYFMAFYGSCNTVCTSMVLQIKLVIDVVGFSYNARPAIIRVWIFDIQTAVQRIVFRNTRRRASFRGGHHVYNKLRWAFLWTWGRGSKIIALTRVRKIGLTRKVVVHRTLLIIIRGVVCCRAGGVVGLLARGVEHKARGGRTQNIDIEPDDREAGRSHMEQETAPRRFFSSRCALR